LSISVMTQLLLQAGPGAPPSESDGERIGIPDLRPPLNARCGCLDATLTHLIFCR
jgi:hypothetical protein